MDLSKLDTSHVNKLSVIEVQQGGILIEEIDNLNLVEGSEAADALKSFLADKLATLQTLKETPLNGNDKTATAPMSLLEIGGSLSRLTVKERLTHIATAIGLTAQDKGVKQGQDYGAFLRLIKECSWLSSISCKSFLSLLETQSGIDKAQLPSESALRVLDFGHTQYPRWVVKQYDAQKTQDLNAMVDYFVCKLSESLQH